MRAWARMRPSHAPPLGAEHDVLDHAQRLHEHEMLVDHADACSDRVGRLGDLASRPADADLARIRLVEAVEDRHQGRLAGAVLADDAVDGAALDPQRDVVIGRDRAEPLGDARKFDRGRRCSGHRVITMPSKARSSGSGSSWASMAGPIWVRMMRGVSRRSRCAASDR